MYEKCEIVATIGDCWFYIVVLQNTKRRITRVTSSLSGSVKPGLAVRLPCASYTEKIVIPKFLSFHRKYSDFMKNIGITKCLGYLKPASLRNVSSSVSSQIGFSSGTAISAVALLIASRFISVSAYA